jgi:preprotein translocase subunit SecE
LRVRALPHLPFTLPERAAAGLTARPRIPERERAMNDKVRWYTRFWNFLKDVRAELKKVTWPAKNEVISTTIVVIAATIFFGFYLFFMDIIFAWVIGHIKSLFG